MKLTEKLFVQNAQRKVSGQGNVYYLIDLVENTGINNEEGQPITRDWQSLYYMPEHKEENVLKHKSQMAMVTLTFYPIVRRVGEKEYQDIRVSVIELKEAE